MPRFEATFKRPKEGIKGMTVSAVVKNIDGWEAMLEAASEPALPSQSA